MAKRLVVKYGMNMCVASCISLPKEGLSLVAVPVQNGMALVCNNRATADDLCKNVGLRIDNYFGDRPVILIDLKTGNDEGVSALIACLRGAGYVVGAQGDIPWQKKPWQ